MLAEHTKRRGRVDVGGGGRRLSRAARGLVSPIASLKIYIQDLAPTQTPSSLALTQRLDLALGKSCL